MEMQKSKKGRIGRKRKYNIAVALPEYHAGLNPPLDTFLPRTPWEAAREAGFGVVSFLHSCTKSKIPILF